MLRTCRILYRIVAVCLSIGALCLWGQTAWRRGQTAGGAVVWLKATPDARTLSAAFSDESIRGFDSETGVERFRFTGFLGQSDNPESCSTSPIFSVQFNNRVRSPLQTLSDFPGLSALKSRTVWLLKETAIIDPQTGRLLYRGTSAGNIDEIPILGESTDLFAVMTRNQKNGQRQLRVFDCQRPTKPVAKLDFPMGVDDPVLSANGNTICCWTPEKGSVLLLNCRTGKVDPVCNRLPGNVASSAWALSNDGRHLVLGLQTGHIEIWNVETETRSAICGPHRSTPEKIVISDDRTWFASVTQDGEVIVAALNNGAMQFRASLDGNPPADIRFLPGINRLAILDRSNTVRWWALDSRDGAPLGKLDTLPGDPTPLELTESGMMVVAGPLGARLIDLTGKVGTRTLAIQQVNESQIRRVAVARNGRLFAAASDSAIEVRDLETGAVVSTCWTAGEQRQGYYLWLAWSAPATLMAVTAFLYVAWTPFQSWKRLV